MEFARGSSIRERMGSRNIKFVKLDFNADATHLNYE
jgi:hypothetical protein